MAERSAPNFPPYIETRPTPDPTELTSTMVNAAKDELRRELTAAQRIIETRLEASENVLARLQGVMDHFPGYVTERLHTLEQLIEQRLDQRSLLYAEQFRGIQNQFVERDARAAQMSMMAKDNVTAQDANVAQTIARIEATTTKQIEQLVTLLQTTAGANSEKIEDIKERVTLIEGRTAGITAATGTQQVVQAQTQQGQSYTVAIIVAIIGGLGLMTTIAMAVFTLTRH